jgi:hypothetical protein
MERGSRVKERRGWSERGLVERLHARLAEVFTDG